MFCNLLFKHFREKSRNPGDNAFGHKLALATGCHALSLGRVTGSQRGAGSITSAFSLSVCWQATEHSSLWKTDRSVVVVLVFFACVSLLFGSDSSSDRIEEGCHPRQCALCTHSSGPLPLAAVPAPARCMCAPTPHTSASRVDPCMRFERSPYLETHGECRVGCGSAQQEGETLKWPRTPAGASPESPLRTNLNTHSDTSAQYRQQRCGRKRVLGDL